MDSSPLGRLPRELRDLIYEHAAVYSDGIKVISVRETEDEYSNDSNPVKPSGSSRNTTLALAMTCRQLHRETINLYYERNDLIFAFDRASIQTVNLFLRMLKPAYAKLLTRIIFEAPEGRYPKGDQRRFRDNWNTLVRQLVTYGSYLLSGPVVLHCQCIFDEATVIPFRYYEPRCFGIRLLLSRDEKTIDEQLGAAVQIRKDRNRYWHNIRFHCPDVDGNDDCLYYPSARFELRKGLS